MSADIGRAAQLDALASDASYFLLTFAPSTGVGFYHFNKEVHEFDVVTGRDEACAGSARCALQLEQDQIDARVGFDTLAQLKTFSRREYLRDKKHNYLFFLLSENLSAQTRRRMLEFLDEPEVADINLDSKVPDVLWEVASMEFAVRTMREAEPFENFRVSFGRDVPKLAIQVLEPALSQIEVHPRAALGWLRTIAAVTSAIRDYPSQLKRQVERLLEALDPHWNELKPHVGREVFALADNTGYGLSTFALRAARHCRTPNDLVTLQDRLLAGATAAPPWTESAALTELGGKLRNAQIRWRLASGWFPFPEINTSLASDESLLHESFRAANQLWGSSFTGSFPDQLRFEVHFARRPERLLSSIEERDRQFAGITLAVRVAFWVSLLQDPEATLATLDAGSLETVYAPGDFIYSTRYCYRHLGARDVGLDARAGVWSLWYPDLVNFAVLGLMATREQQRTDTQLQDAISVIEELSESVRSANLQRATGIPDPLDLLMNNVLAIAMHRGDLNVVQRLGHTVADRLRPTGFKPVVRFVI